MVDSTVNGSSLPDTQKMETTYEPQTPPPEYEEIEKVPVLPLDEKCVVLPDGAVAVSLLDPTIEIAARKLEEKVWIEAARAKKEKDEPWSDLSCCGKLLRVGQYVTKFMALLVLLYFFICSLDFLSSAFRLVGGKMAGEAFSSNSLISNPICGLMIGILATVLVQSSSTSTSIVVTMVASGILEVRPAIPIVMGANIGTSVTNTVVSLAQSGDRDEFRRAFAGATVHDMFNWLSVIVLLPLEAGTGYLYHLTSLIVSSYNLQSTVGSKQDLLKTLTKPFTERIVKLDKKVIEAIALGDESAYEKSLIKEWCLYEDIVEEKNVTTLVNVTAVTGDWFMQNVSEVQNVTTHMPTEKCTFLFSYFGLSDLVSGLILLGVSLFMLCVCLILMVKLLHSMLQGRIAKVIKKTLNADFPGKLAYFTDYVAILIGAGMTILVQSSSVFTSAMTPLVGMGMIEIERMYPLTLGSNMGTTATGMLAAMAASSDKLEASLQIALCHLMFNVSGILLFFPIPATRFPIKLAKIMGNTTAKYRWFAIFYLIVMFVVVPGMVFALSMLGAVVMLSVVITALAIFLLIVAINIVQRKRSHWLPAGLRSWDFLPEFLHSLKPLDRLVQRLACCRKCTQPNGHQELVTVGSSLDSSMNSSATNSGTVTPASCHSTSLLVNPKISAV